MKLIENSDNSLAEVTSLAEKQALEEFRARVQDISKLNCPLDDVYLLTYLRFGKMDVNKSVRALTKWWEDRHKSPELYDGIYPSTFANIYNKPAKEKFLVTLPYRDHLGRQVLLFKPGNWTPAETPILEIFMSNFPIIDTITSRQLSQLKGVVVIVDLENFGFKHVSSVGPYDIKTVIGCTDGFPLNIKQVHFINNSILFNGVWAMAKLVIKNKMQKRIHFHGYNHRSLHEFVDPRLLPGMYGGDLGSDDFEEPEFTKLLLGREDYFKDLLDNRGMLNYL